MISTQVLEEIGLSNAEAKIYLALLELGESKTGAVIDLTKLQSSTVYHGLGSLLKKGLISFVHKGKIKFYRSESPESVREFLDSKRRKFESVFDDLKEREKIGKLKKDAKVFQGVKGIRQAYNDVLLSMKKGEEYCFLQVPPEKVYDEDINLFFRNYHLTRDSKGIKVKGISPKNSKKIISKMHEGLKHSKLKYTDESFPLGLVIYKNKVITLDWDQVPTAFVIESETVANSYKKYFNQLWKRAKF